MVVFYLCQVYKTYNQNQHQQIMTVLYSEKNQIITNYEVPQSLDVRDVWATLCNQQKWNWK